MKNPLVSVIVPVYNVENYLRRCLDSIVCQTYKNLEIILIDDGSTDKSGKICDEYAKKDKRIKVIHKENEGVAIARNDGISKTTGKYIAFIDSDDYVDTNYINFLISIAITNDTDIVQCDSKLFMDNKEKQNVDIKKIYDTKIISGLDGAKCMLYQSLVNSSLWGKIIKKSLFNKLKFPEKKTHEDLYGMYFLLVKAKKVAVTQIPMYFYRYRQDSLIHEDSSRHMLDLLDIMHDIKEDAKKYPTLKSAINSRMINADFFVLRQLSEDNKKLKKHLWADVKKKRIQIIKDPMVRNKTKIGSIASFLGLPMVKIIYRTFGKVYNTRRIQ